MRYPIGTNIRDINHFDRGIKVVFACKEHPEYEYMSKQPSVSNWFPANEAARLLQWGNPEKCHHKLKDDVWFTTREYDDGQPGPDWFEQLAKAKDNGLAYAMAGIMQGETVPQDSPLSGEWAGALTPRDVVEGAAGPGTFENAQEWEVTELCDSWEDGYNGAPWPGDPKFFPVGSDVDLVRYGKWEGPFTVTDKEGRTPEHLVLRNPENGVLFEEHVDKYASHIRRHL